MLDLSVQRSDLDRLRLQKAKPPYPLTYWPDTGLDRKRKERSEGHPTSSDRKRVKTTPITSFKPLEALAGLRARIRAKAQLVEQVVT